MKKYLTRSEYCLGVRCPALLWTLRNEPEALSPYSERNVIHLHNLEAVRRYTDTLSGVTFIRESDPETESADTAKALAAGALDISGATFISGSLSARCDLIRRRSDGTYALLLGYWLNKYVYGY